MSPSFLKFKKVLKKIYLTVANTFHKLFSYSGVVCKEACTNLKILLEVSKVMLNKGSLVSSSLASFLLSCPLFFLKLDATQFECIRELYNICTTQVVCHSCIQFNGAI